MNQPDDKVKADRQLLLDAQARGGGAKIAAYLKLSGPGWLQSAITLGGGSLASSLYLGVLAGFSMLWLQPIAMILGIVMLSAIGYVTMSTGERPFQAINRHINPVLGWGWALACAAANVVWCLPQYSLANGVVRQNLLPKVFGEEGFFSAKFAQQFGAESWFASNGSSVIVVGCILLFSIVITWSYDKGGWGVRLYETMLKLLVALIVLCFGGVVVQLSLSDNPLDWNAIFRGFVPNVGQFFHPAETFAPLLDAIGPVGDSARDYWSDRIVSQQQDVMVSAAATAVGINMTFLFPYSILRKGWTKEFRGLAIFDLSTGMLIPFLLATSCVVIASASQFHTKPAKDFKVDGNEMTVPERFRKPFAEMIAERTEKVSLDESNIRLEEQELAATLVNRKATDLSESLAPFTGEFIADIAFGIGVLAMTLSSISLLMLISGFVFCEVLAIPPSGWGFRIGTLLPAAGVLGPFFWSKAAFYLAVPTSVFGFVLLPLAYLTFALLMNQRKLLGDNLPRGMKRVLWNLLMGFSAAMATVGSVYMVWKKAGYGGIAAVVAFALLALMVQINRRNEAKESSESTQ